MLYIKNKCSIIGYPPIQFFFAYVLIITWYIMLEKEIGHWLLPVEAHGSVGHFCLLTRPGDDK